jgi:hypothetical protein
VPLAKLKEAATEISNRGYWLSLVWLQEPNQTDVSVKRSSSSELPRELERTLDRRVEVLSKVHSCRSPGSARRREARAEMSAAVISRFVRYSGF